MIYSCNNAKVKLVRKLNDAKFRNQYDKFVIEGVHLIEEALRSGAAIEYILYSTRYADLFSRCINIPLIEVTPNVYKKISSVESPQGILAVLNKMQYKREDIIKHDSKNIVLCSSIQDPGNLGAIVRIAAAAGSSGIIISDDSADIFNPKSIRASQGAIFCIPFVKSNNVAEIIDKCRDIKMDVYSADPRAVENYCDIDLKKPFAVIIGNEGHGIKEEIFGLCTKRIKIPMKNNVESLNCAASLGIILFESLRQRNQC